MIPGMMCDERIFAPQIEGLSDSIRIIVADISGHSTVQDLAAEVLQKITTQVSSLRSFYGRYCRYGDVRPGAESN